MAPEMLPWSRMAARRGALEVRTVLVNWRDVMSDIRAGYIPASRESVARITEWALERLHEIERRYDAAPTSGPHRLATLIAEARSEVQGATFHDLADSGEEAG